MPPEKPNLIYDGCLDFSLGINSGISVPSLPKNQAAFAVNCTFRNDFPTDRPPVRKIILNDDIKALVSSAFKTNGLFQGATSYQPDAGLETLTFSVAGRLFSVLPNTTGHGSGSEITIPGDPNSAIQPQAWLWQAERWLIVQNGLQVPIFWDGVASRRSQPDSIVIGTVDVAGFVAPAIGATVTIPLTGPFTGLVNTDFYVGDATYLAKEIGGATTVNNLVLKNLHGTAGATIAAGQQLIIQPANLGYGLDSPLTISGGFFHGTIVFTVAAPASVVIGTGLQSASSGIWSVEAISGDRKTLSVKSATATNLGASGTEQVLIVGSSAPNVVSGVVGLPFTVPAVNASVTIQIAAPYTQPLAGIVFIGDTQWQLVSTSTTNGGANSVLAENLNDIPATAYASGTQLFSIPELPIGRMGTYGMGRDWVSLIDGISFIAGDIVGGSSGSPAYNYRDAVLKVTENTYLAGGGTFRVPAAGETITGMAFVATMDTSLGQGPLQVFTNRNVFSCNTPVDRNTWQSLTNPILTETLKGAGASSQYAITNSNADILFRSPDAQLRSLVRSRLDFNRWGNTPMSYEVLRIINSENQDLLNFCSAIEYDNRWLVTCQPLQSAHGVYWRGLIALNFDPISSLQGKADSIYDGLWTGLNVFQLVNFKSSNRAFAFCFNPVLDELELYELFPTGSEHFDNGNVPIVWSFETPALFRDSKGKSVFDLLKLEDGELYVSDIIGRVDFKVEYRADYDTCWQVWRQWHVCAKQEGADPRPQYRNRLGFGQPAFDSVCNVNTDRPPMYGTMFQLRVSVQGHCVINGFRLSASLQPIPKFSEPECNDE